MKKVLKKTRMIVDPETHVNIPSEHNSFSDINVCRYSKAN